jgi:peptide chain release factor 2
MNLLELKAALLEAKDKFAELKQTIGLEKLNARLKTLDQATLAPSFWSDQKQAHKTIQEQNEIKAILTQYQRIEETLETLSFSYELAEVDQEFDFQEVEQLIADFNLNLENLTIKTLLDKPYDKSNAIMEFHPGAGGTESQDWAEMLFRMYTRWIEKSDFKMTVLDYQDGEEAGLKSATILVQGTYAFGYLKAESGVHRLVRISPFDASGRRHTSFASVTVIPEIDDTIEVEINNEDLRIDTYRSSGKGGQGVNTTDSAVRITHLPTKIVVTCQNERSQLQNRETAMRVLRGKLYHLELERKQQQLEGLSTANVANAFGSQIRSYTFHPYCLVKDHRTNVETGAIQKVMDGDIDQFINAFLINAR